jgi:hypothetical protein
MEASMSLDIYTPKNTAGFFVRQTNIKIVGVHKMEISIDRSEAVYYVWIKPDNTSNILFNSYTDSIKLSPQDLDINCFFYMEESGDNLLCKIKKATYNSSNHAYLIMVELTLDKKKILDIVYEKNKKENYLEPNKKYFLDLD